jgi:hypothetical protein
VPDNRHANNMRQISESFFMSDFWYRAHLQAPQTLAGQHTYLHFDGITWKAEVYLNGQPVGTSTVPSFVGGSTTRSWCARVTTACGEGIRTAILVP